MRGFDGRVEKRSARSCVCASIGAILLGAVILPGEALIGGRLMFRLPARSLGVCIAAVCIAAFLQCPRRNALAKLVTLVLVVPGAFVGIFCLADYVLAVQSQNQVVEYFLLCRRLGLC
jgi:hypothetical protein